MSRIGKELEAGINAAPPTGDGISQRSHWCAHEGRLYVETESSNRAQVLAQNVEMRKALEGRKRDDNSPFSENWLRIPRHDYNEIMASPAMKGADHETQRKEWQKQMILHPEWFIG